LNELKKQYDFTLSKATKLRNRTIQGGYYQDSIKEENAFENLEMSDLTTVG
jgi:hypothetical protein